MEASVAIPNDLARQAVIALTPENPTGAPPAGLHAGSRVLAPVHHPRGYAKHRPATVLQTPQVDDLSERVSVVYDHGHGVGNYGPIRHGEVFAVDLLPLN